MQANSVLLLRITTQILATGKYLHACKMPILKKVATVNV